MVNYNFTICKICSSTNCRVRYKLLNTNVLVCPDCGFYYINHLDPESDSKVDSDALTEKQREYIKNALQSNRERFRKEIEIVESCTELQSSKVLDVGCGGGMFLSMLKERGAHVRGNELSDSRITFARTEYGLDVQKYPVEHSFWQENFREAFDVITLWDVIEHVNFPVETIRAAVNLLRPGGSICLDTPCRDGFYHRLGVVLYKLTRGKIRSFMDLYYSSQPGGHKQIFTTSEIKNLLEGAGLTVIRLDKLHELALPLRFSLRKIVHSRILASVLVPPCGLFLWFSRIRNKMLAIARKS